MDSVIFGFLVYCWCMKFLTIREAREYSPKKQTKLYTIEYRLRRNICYFIVKTFLCHCKYEKVNITTLGNLEVRYPRPCPGERGRAVCVAICCSPLPSSVENNKTCSIWHRKHVCSVTYSVFCFSPLCKEAVWRGFLTLGYQRVKKTRG